MAYDSLRGATVANRSGLALGDTATLENFAADADITRIRCSNERDLIIHGRGSEPSTDFGVVVAWYDADDVLVFTEDERTLTTGAIPTAEEDTKFISASETYEVPGASFARLYYSTPAASGSMDLHAGVR